MKISSWMKNENVTHESIECSGGGSELSLTKTNQLT